MRVPDISATAGYAATVFNPINNQRENHSTNSLLLSALGTGHNNKYDNTPISPGTPNYYRQTTPTTAATANSTAVAAATGATATASTITNYASSADEFIQKALNSTPTEYSPPILNHLNDNNIVPHYCCGALPKTFTNSFEDCYDKEANNTGNTYKSFKEIFNTNKSFYEDCVRDFENINLLKNGSDDHVTDTDLDPIQLINSRETPNSNNDCGGKHICTNPFDEAFSRYNAAHAKKLQTQNLEEFDHKSEDLIETEKVESGFEPDDNDYDDHSMIDLCSDTKSIYDSDEKEDDFLTSASSSSGSLHTPKHSFFPRGIINPNYPGFQHLAHTLSEHFITSSPSDSYESDMSEYEMELSADSFESLNEEKSQIQLNTYNNNTPEKIPPNPNNEQQQHNTLEYIQSLDADAHDDDDDVDEFCLMECSKGHRPSLDDDTNSNSHSNNKHQPFNIVDLQDHLKNTLTLLEKQDCGLQHHNNLPPVSITPDILIKNYNLQVQPLHKKENRPDLLRGVSPHLLPERKYHETKNSNIKMDKPPNDKCYGIRNAENKDEMSYGLTPVDIIGDFGQEVEREFGLLVSGYRRLVDTQDIMPMQMDEGGKIPDAVLSIAKDQIDTNKYLEALNKQTENEEVVNKISPELADDNAVDIPLSPQHSQNSPTQKETQTKLQTPTNPPTCPKSDMRSKPKYQKSSYDDRQLPPVAIEYKRCQQTSRSTKKTQSNHIEKPTKITKPKTSIASRLFHNKRNGNKADSNSNRKREEAEFNQYQQLISDKEQILSNSKYAKLSSWAQYLKGSVNERGKRGSADLSPSALELFDAYKIGTEVDMEELQEHLKMAKEIEKKRRSDREEIRRRLAMGAEENCNEQQQTQYQQSERNLWKSSIQSRLQNDFTRISELSSDTDSHSSDSDTCPKLSKSKSQIGAFSFNGSQISINDNQSQIHPYHGRPLSVSCSNNSNISNNNNTTTTKALSTQQQELQQQLNETFSNEDRECDFFTKQAKLQIEARMALSQAKEMAHMQMEIERQNQRVSPITAIIRDSLDKVGVQIKPDKRRLSRQLLTDMNIAQLQILVNNLHTHIEELNESLVNYLMERDDLHDGQDTMLVDIEELTRYIGAKEHIAQQERISSANKCSK